MSIANGESIRHQLNFLITLEITMNKVAEQFTTANKAGIETLQTVANTSLTGLANLTLLNLNTVRALVEDSAANAKALLAVKDVQGLLALQKSLAQPAVEKTIAYSRSVYEILSQSSNGVTQVVEEQVSEVNKNVNSAIEKALKNAPAGSEVAVTAVKSAIAAANSAYSNISKVAKQATEMAEANVAAANAATVKLVKKAA
jgi:phasin family protein